MTNLLLETLDDLESRGKTPGDVRWIGSRDGSIAFGWDRFAELADVEYDSGFGSNEVPLDLVVVGDGWWLERYEYDGAEHWAFQCPPIREPDATDHVHRIIPGCEWGLFPSRLADCQLEEQP